MIWPMRIMLADLHVDLRQVAVAGGETVAVIDLDHVAVAALQPAIVTVPVAVARTGSPVSPRKSRPVCIAGRAEERIDAHAERRTHVDLAVDRLAHRHGASVCV